MNPRRVSYTRTTAYSIQYHLVFVTKYRRKVLSPEVMKDLIDYIHELATQQSYSILKANGEEDHIHLLINATPQDCIPNIVKQLKGPTARELFKKHPEIKQQLWGGHLWSPSYFVATTNDNISEQIREYIRRQGER